MLHEHDLTWLVKLVIWPWSLSTCRLKSSFSSFIRSLSLLSFLKSSSKIFTWSAKKEKAAEGKSTRNYRSVCKCSVYLTCSLSTAIWVSSSCFLKLLAASAKLPWPGGCWEDEGECRFKASSKAWIRQINVTLTETSLRPITLFASLPHSLGWGVGSPSLGTLSVCWGAPADPASSGSSASARPSQCLNTPSPPGTNAHTPHGFKNTFSTVTLCPAFV